MKSYEEMAESVFRRRDRYMAEKKAYRKKIIFTASCFGLLVLFAGLSYGGKWNRDAAISEPLPQADIKEPENSSVKYKQKAEPDSDSVEDSSELAVFPQETEMDGQGIEIDDIRRIDTEKSDSESLPIEDNIRNTGALTACEDVWGGSYMDDVGHWVILLTENTEEYQRRVFELNPTLLESDAIFKKADYTLAYLTDLMVNLSRAELPFVTTIGLKEDLNQVEVVMTENDENAIAEVLAFDTIGGAVKLVIE